MVLRIVLLFITGCGFGLVAVFVFRLVISGLAGLLIKWDLLILEFGIRWCMFAGFDLNFCVWIV